MNEKIPAALKKIVIAIDGYSSCGKSTLAKAIARKLHYNFIDSGSMYRAVTLYFVQQKITLEKIKSMSTEELESVLDNIQITFKVNPETGLSEVYLNGKNVEGFQAAGIVNTATGTLNGVQAGGVVNTVIDTMNGLQLGGALNLSLSNKPSAASWQIAGAANVSLWKSTGGQIAGAFNVANEHNGIQIGTINFSKKISGFQLGIINIADSIDGESIGLINIYRNGIHNVDVFGSEVLFANAGLKLGSPHVYTMFAFGIRPYSDLTRMGLGIGIGGHIPLNHGFVNIDGVCWSIHNGNFKDWNNVNLWNQIRFMYGYQITKGISIYAGPTLNAQVYDLSYPSIAPYTIYQSNGSPTRVDGWIGGVIGIQFF